MFSRRPSKHSDVQHDDVLPFYVDLPKHNSDVGERMVIADAHQYASGPAAYGFRRKVGFLNQSELIDAWVRSTAPLCELF